MASRTRPTTCCPGWPRSSPGDRRGAGRRVAPAWRSHRLRRCVAAGRPEADRAPAGEVPEVPRRDRRSRCRTRASCSARSRSTRPPGEPLTPAEDEAARRRRRAGRPGAAQRSADRGAARPRASASWPRRTRSAPLERNIHDGAQQQLVALAVKLRLARALVAAGPGRGARDARRSSGGDADALENLRDLARGIYPPLLADKGLVAALDGAGRKSRSPVDGRDRTGRSGVPRGRRGGRLLLLPRGAAERREVREARGRATVRLAQVDGSLRFEVTDDGVGFDPARPRTGPVCRAWPTAWPRWRTARFARRRAGTAVPPAPCRWEPRGHLSERVRRRVLPWRRATWGTKKRDDGVEPLARLGSDGVAVAVIARSAAVPDGTNHVSLYAMATSFGACSWPQHRVRRLAGARDRIRLAPRAGHRMAVPPDRRRARARPEPRDRRRSTANRREPASLPSARPRGRDRFDDAAHHPDRIDPHPPTCSYRTSRRTAVASSWSSPSVARSSSPSRRSCSTDRSPTCGVGRTAATRVAATELPIGGLGYSIDAVPRRSRPPVLVGAVAAITSLFVRRRGDPRQRLAAAALAAAAAAAVRLVVCCRCIKSHPPSEPVRGIFWLHHHAARRPRAFSIDGESASREVRCSTFHVVIR